MRLLCTEKHVVQLMFAMEADGVPAWMMTTTGPGWVVEFFEPHPSPEVQKFIDRGEVTEVGK